MSAPKSVVFNRKDHRLILASGTERTGYDGDVFMLHVDDLKGMRPPELKAALSRVMDGDEVRVNITQDDRVDEDYSLVEAIDFTYADGQLLVTLNFATDHYDYDEQGVADSLGSILHPYLRRNRAAFVRAELDPYHQAPFIWHVVISCSTRNRDMADMFCIGEGALALLQAYESGELSGWLRKSFGG
ncbi:hypothetical protein [Kitasatospora sp. NPDC050463]|uniref:hypothetical protein n=1 Tax=Kitasatospora sp. NPDC050463 TaxID=3155786 RepID=UPI0033F3CE0B